MKEINKIITQIPPEQRITVKFTHSIDHIPFDFIIQFTVFGEVLSVESPYFQLPVAAQRMMANAQQRMLLQNFMDVLPLIVPLAMRREFKGEEWQFFADEYERLTAKAPYVWKPYGRKRLNEDWLDAVFNMTQSWGHVIEDLLHYDKTKMTKGLNKLYGKLATGSCLQFVIKYLPTLTHYGLEGTVVRILKRQPTPESLNIFLKISQGTIVNDMIQVPCLQGIHHFRTQEIEDYLLERYINHPNFALNTMIIAELIKASEKYQHPNFAKYLFAIIDNGLPSARRAAVILKRKGITEKVLYQHIYPYFKNNKSQAHVNNVIHICGQFKNKKLRPSINEMIDKIEFQGFYVSIKELYPRLTRPAFERLLKLSYSDNKKIQQTAMGQLAEMGEKDYFPHLLKRFEQTDEATRIRILQMLPRIIGRTDVTSFLSWFLKTKEDNNQMVRAGCMRCIEIMYRNKAIKPPIYEELLRDVARNDVGNNAKSVILLMLSWYPTDESKKILWSFTNAPDRILKNAAIRALEVIKNEEKRNEQIVKMRSPTQPIYDKHNYPNSNRSIEQLMGLVAIILMGWLVKILWSVINS